jgi:hypothetical protein
MQTRMLFFCEKRWQAPPEICRIKQIQVTPQYLSQAVLSFDKFRVVPATLN